MTTASENLGKYDGKGTREGRRREKERGKERKKEEERGGGGENLGGVFLIL